MDMTLNAILKRVEQGETTQADADQLRRWLLPDDQAKTVQAYLHLMCNAEDVRQYLAADIREGLAAELTKDRPA